MRLHAIGGGSLLIEADNCRILVDPFLGGDDPTDRCEPAAGHRVRQNQLPDYDLLVISSRDARRFDVRSLAALPRDVEVLIPADPELAHCLQQLGYSRVSQVAPFEERRFDSTLLVPTPGRSPFESGLVIADRSGVVWSLADLEIDDRVVDAVRGRFSKIDLLLAGWRSRPSGGLLSSPDAELSRYWRRLRSLSRIEPGALVPWGDPEPPDPPDPAGSSRIAGGLRVPVSRERFAHDASLARPGLSGRISGFDFGDVVALDRKPGDEAEVRREPNGCPFVTGGPSALLAAAGRSGSETAAGFDDRVDGLGERVVREVEHGLTRYFGDHLDSELAEHRRWRVCYQLEVTLEDRSWCWFFDFSSRDESGAVPATRGATALANFRTKIAAEALDALIERRRDWAAVVLGGGYGSTHACYAISAGGLERPEQLADPLALRYDREGAFLAVREREIETERARWAARLLARVRSSDSNGARPALPEGESNPESEAGQIHPRRRTVAPSIPVVVTEEHHEAFLVWHSAIRRGWLEPTGNRLLHVDQHADMKAPRFHRPLPPADADLAEIESFTYEELDIESFVASGCFQGLFRRVDWLQRDRSQAARRFCVTSLRGEGMVLELHDQAAGEAKVPADVRWIEWRTVRPQDRDLDPGPDAGVILDIDLDYFSCDEALNRGGSIEITASELEAFRSDPFHPMRMGNRFRSRVEDGRCYLDYNCFDEVLRSPLRVDEAEITSRVAELVAFLRAHRIQPSLIHVTRSRHSGFTPADQWRYIEEQVLAGLHALYDLRQISIDEIRGRAVLPAGAGQAGAQPRIHSATLPVLRSSSFPSYLDFAGGRVLMIPTGCNNRCSFCMVDEFIETNDHRGRPRGEAPLSAELTALIEDLPAGHRVDFFGAEPTLHESFFNLLALAAARGLRITLASNGRVFSSHAYTRRVKGLAPPEALEVRTSILGATAEVHDAISGARGSFDQLLKGVTNLRAEGYAVHFNMVLTRDNLHQAEATARLGVACGAASMKISGLIDLERNAASFVPYRETAAAVESFCEVCAQAGVPFAIEKLPLCVAPSRMNHFVYEQGVYAPDRGLLQGPGQPCHDCLVRNVCFGVEPAFAAAFGAEGLRTVAALPEAVLLPVEEILEGRADPQFYRVAFTRVDADRLALDDWSKLLGFKRRCQGEVGDLCIERVADPEGRATSGLSDHLAIGPDRAAP